MHDPMTQAATWPKYGTRLYKLIGTQFTLWHRDPETDGSDDSCGWSFVKVPKEIRGNLDFDAGQEAKYPWFQRDCAKEPQAPADAEFLLRGALLFVAHVCGLKLSYEGAALKASRLLHNPVDNIRSTMCFLPGWHSNNSQPTEWDRKEHAKRFFWILARSLMTDARPWYRHPRWHVHHWRLQVHLWQQFRRAWFDRCSKCGKGFSWGYCPMGNWAGTEIWHNDCDNPKSNNCVQGSASS